MISFIDKVKNFFLSQKLPGSAFQISSRYVAGVNISNRERTVKHHFFQPLAEGVIQPSFHSKNIIERESLKKKIEEGLKKIQLEDKHTLLLIPELSQKIFVFTFESFPSSHKERERIIRFRVKKQIPLLPEDARFSFDASASPGQNQKQIVASVVRISVIKEYEDFFKELQLDVRTVAVPSLSLFNLLNLEKEKDVILVNIEGDFFSLLGIVNSEVVLYRQKPMDFNGQAEKLVYSQVESLVQEITKTAQFITDKEKKTISNLRVRVGLTDFAEEILRYLEEKSQLSVKGVNLPPGSGLSSAEKKMLTPLIGEYQ